MEEQTLCFPDTQTLIDDCLSLDRANDLLIYRNYEECFEVCQKGLNILRSNTEVSGAEELKTALCVNGIQALAELSRWQEVIPFVTKNYPNIEETPAAIIQLCVLLHAQVRDYPTCVALVNLWLRHPHNCQPCLLERYLETIDIYVGHVLIPANRWEDIEPFLQSCPALAAERLEGFLRTVRTLRHQLEQAKAEQIEEIPEDDETPASKTSESITANKNRKAQEKKRSHKSVVHKSKFSHFMSRISEWVVRNVPVVTFHVLQHLSVILLVLYLVGTRADVEMLSWKTLHKVWRFWLSMWRRMFAPFHQAKG